MAAVRINQLKLIFLAIILTLACWTFVNIFIAEMGLIKFLVMEFVIASFQILFNFVRQGLESNDKSESQEVAEEPEDENPLNQSNDEGG